MPDVGTQDPQQQQQQPFYDLDVIKGNVVPPHVQPLDAPGPTPGDQNNPMLNTMVDPGSDAYQRGLRDGQHRVPGQCLASPVDDQNYQAGYAAGMSQPPADAPPAASGPALGGPVPGGVPQSEIEEQQCRQAQQWSTATLPCTTEVHVHDTHPNPEEEEKNDELIRNAGTPEPQIPETVPVE